MEHYKTTLRLIFHAAVVGCGMAIRLAHASTQCSDPKVQAELQRSYSGWQVVRVEDLRPEDRGLWVKQHGTDCPGVFKARLKSKVYESYAVTIFKKTPELQQGLLVFSEGQGIHSVDILIGPEKVAYLSVISKVSPGTYVGVNGKRVGSSLDSVLYEAIEAGSILYYFKDQRFHSITLSE